MTVKDLSYATTNKQLSGYIEEINYFKNANI